MYRILNYFFLISTLTVLSCGGEDENLDEDIDLNETLDSLSQEFTGPLWQYQSALDAYEIEIPTAMVKMDELNPTASLEYGFIEDLGDYGKENYIIALDHLKADLEVESPDFEYNVENYSELSVHTLMGGKEWYEVINEVENESINGLNARIHEIEAHIAISDTSEVHAYYVLGVFESETAFYQVLTWTLLDQKSDFENDMMRMVRSFREIKDGHEHNHDHHEH